MSEFTYRPTAALRAILLEMAIIAFFTWIVWSDGDTYFLLIFPGFALLLMAVRFGYLINNSLVLEGGALTLHRRTGPDRRVELSDIRRYRIGEFRGQAAHRYRQMVVFHDGGKLTINVSDLYDEAGFIRALEGRLDGKATALVDPSDESPSFLERVANRITG
ncbi:hypothetical protein GGR26_002610 [Lewinella marina]|uniref:DUF304 domain-containing protein n=1 Tax=Neolewinella marina TaxID=438751 RepID=A0A2G0CDD3_9BACT|nr:hypothetical protein [Neolewinella marina]NJB86833.1 hypothetical protein [Neolewinella marina]PHK97965.1 hypothetical protein CGL56_14235 [Neolewinella marina]